MTLKAWLLHNYRKMMSITLTQEYVVVAVAGLVTHSVAAVAMLPSVMAVNASVPGQRSPSAARAAAKTRLAADLGLREGARLRRSPGTARAPTTKLAPRPNAFGAFRGDAQRGGPSRSGRIWLGSAQKPV